MKILRILLLVGGLAGLTGRVLAQSNWKMALDSTQFNYNDTSKIARSGAVVISQQHKHPLNNMMLISTRYDSLLARGLYVGMNEPRYDLDIPDSTAVGLIARPQDSSQGLIVNNFANFKTGVIFPDVHTSSGEFNIFRGSPDTLGYRDGGQVAKLATVKVSGTFGHNARPYRTTDFDLINLRLFTDSEAGNPAVIDNFYGLRLEGFRGVNPGIINQGWGIYIAPAQLKNYFSGSVGIGTTVIAHALTVSAPTDPIQVTGLQYGTDDTDVLTIDAQGVFHKKTLPTSQPHFVTTTGDTVLSPDVNLYIHKGGDARFTVPPAASRKGQSWRIVNLGSGTITLSEPFCVGNEARQHIFNSPDAYTFQLFSDGEVYMALH
ncbi:hypothetical protein GBK04_22385 [Cytophagaceae bacterium SJW1-29]|uniref:Uncharacterized protein n=2 Tax=Salmonirosea aquatica TaxID=2654236 RepID=A0A7C9BF04_9BACT|nr:hypothetical protein [Cytophagaceae bacterium SJW1-29]